MPAYQLGAQIGHPLSSDIGRTPKKPSPPSLTSSACSVGTGPLSGGFLEVGADTCSCRAGTKQAALAGRVSKREAD